MNKSNSIETVDRTSLTDQTKFSFNEISKTETYFNKEIKERKLNSIKLNNYVAAFDYIDKILIVLSTLIRGVSFTTVIGAPVGIASASFNLIFLTTGIIKKLLSIARNKKKKHDTIFFLQKVNYITLKLLYLRH